MDVHTSPVDDLQFNKKECYEIYSSTIPSSITLVHPSENSCHLSYKFVITREVASFLTRQKTETSCFRDEFFDDKDRTLMKRNLWLKRRTTYTKEKGFKFQWSLKDSTESTDAYIRYTCYTDINEILAKLSEVFQRSFRSAISIDLQLKVLAAFDVARYTFNPKADRHIYIDKCRFADNDFYLVGTMCFEVKTEEEWAEALQPNFGLVGYKHAPPHSACHSTVIEYLLHYDPDKLTEEYKNRRPDQHSHYSQEPESLPLNFDKEETAEDLKLKGQWLNVLLEQEDDSDYDENTAV